MEKNLDGLIKRYMDLNYFPSLVVKAFGAKEIFYEKAFGDAKLDTLFDVASLTKIVTSTLVLKFIGEGRFSLQSSLEEVLPAIGAYKNLRDKFGKTSIQELLTHSSGLIDWYPFYTSGGDFLHILNKIYQKTEKIKGTLYSDLNFMLLGEIIKYTSGKNLDDCLNDYIKEPLAIEDIYYNPRNKENIAPSSYGNIIEENMCRERNLIFEKWRDRERELIGEVNDGNGFYFFKGLAGHAGIFANADAYLKLGRMYLESKESLILNSMKDFGGNRGLGWQMGEMYPYGCGHTGFTGTSIWISRDKGLGVVIFSNRLMGNWQKSNLNQFRREVHEMLVKYF